MQLIREVFDFFGVPILILVFTLLFIVETKWKLRKRVQGRWRRIVINSLVSLPAFTLLRFLFLPLVIWLATQNGSWKFGLNYFYSLPLWVEGAIAFLVLDYTNCLWHLLNHKLPSLWRFHLVHHTDLDLDVSTATRFHFMEMTGSVVFRGAAILLTGASPLLVLVYEIVFEAATQFHHSNLKLPFTVEKMLNKLIVTPRMHGIHHSMIKNETDSNYSVIFSFWDRINGTMKLNLPQQAIVTGVPSYSNPQELTISFLLALPFKKIRPWQTPGNEAERVSEESRTTMVK